MKLSELSLADLFADKRYYLVIEEIERRLNLIEEGN